MRIIALFYERDDSFSITRNDRRGSVFRRHHREKDTGSRGASTRARWCRSWLQQLSSQWHLCFDCLSTFKNKPALKGSELQHINENPW